MSARRYARPIRLRLEHRHRRGDEPREVRKIGGNDDGVVRLRDVRKRGDVLFGDLEVHRLDSARGLDRLCDLADRFRVRLGDREDRRRMALRLVDLGLLLAL